MLIRITRFLSPIRISWSYQSRRFLSYNAIECSTIDFNLAIPSLLT